MYEGAGRPRAARTSLTGGDDLEVGMGREHEPQPPRSREGSLCSQRPRWRRMLTCFHGPAPRLDRLSGNTYLGCFSIPRLLIGTRPRGGSPTRESEAQTPT